MSQRWRMVVLHGQCRHPRLGIEGFHVDGITKFDFHSQSIHYWKQIVFIVLEIQKVTVITADSCSKIFCFDGDILVKMVLAVFGKWDLYFIRIKFLFVSHSNFFVFLLIILLMNWNIRREKTNLGCIGGLHSLVLTQI